MTLFDQIEQQYKESLKKREADVLEVIRGLKSEIKNFLIEIGALEISDSDVIKIIKTEIKKRKDAITLYIQGARQELADKEQQEILVLERFLPEQLSEEVVRAKVSEIIDEIGDITLKDIGMVIARAMDRLGDAVDGSVVARIVKEHITKKAGKKQ